MTTDVDAQSMLDETVANIDTYRADATTAIAALAAFRPAYYTPSELPAPALASPGSVAPASIGSAPSIPSVGKANIGTVSPVVTKATDPSTNPYQPLQGQYPQYQDAKIDQSLATSFTADFSSIQPTLFTWLHSQIQSIVNSGGQNISGTVQDAVFNQGYERLMQTTRDALDLTGARTGAKGCRYPNSMTKAQQNEIVLNFTWQRNDVSRNITQAMADFAQKNIQAAIAAGVSVDEARVKVFTETKAALTNVQRLVVEQYRVDLQANLNTFEQNMQLQLADLGVQRANREEMRAYISMQREQLDLEGRINIAQFDAQTKAELSRVESDRSVADYQSRAELAEYDAVNRAQFMRVETDRMIQELVRSGNEQAVRIFATQVSQQVALQQQSFADSQEQNKLAVGVLSSVARSYIEVAKSLSAQSVSIVTKKGN